MSVVRVMIGMASEQRERRNGVYLRPVTTKPVDVCTGALLEQSEALSERTITITGVDPVEVLGANDQNLRIIRGRFPKLSIMARGDTVKVIGDGDEVDALRGALRADWWSTWSATTNCRARCSMTSWAAATRRRRPLTRPMCWSTATRACA